MSHQQIQYNIILFRSFLKTQQEFITEYYEYIKFLPSRVIHDENSNVIKQTFRDRNGDEIDIGCNTIRLYELVLRI